jgi:hypothetical protein
VNDLESRLRELLNESIDGELGPEGPAPVFHPPTVAAPSRRRHLRRWAFPLLAAAAVAVIFAATALANRHADERRPVPPASSAPAPTATRPATTPPRQLPPPASHPRASESPAATGSSAPARSTSPASQPPGRAANIVDFGGYGPVDLGLTAGQVATLEPALTRNAFGAGCVQFFGQAPAAIGGPMFNIVLTPPSNRVVGISVPATAVTDTGLRVGSTRAQVAAAYPGRHTEITGSQGGTVFLVQGSTSWLGFLLDQSGAVKSMSVGSKAFAAQQELCVSG